MYIIICWRIFLLQKIIIRGIYVHVQNQKHVSLKVLGSVQGNMTFKEIYNTSKCIPKRKRERDGEKGDGRTNLDECRLGSAEVRHEARHGEEAANWSCIHGPNRICHSY